MLRKAASNPNRNDDDTMSIESSERRPFVPTGKTLEIPIGEGAPTSSTSVASSHQHSNYSHPPPHNLPPPPHHHGYPPHHPPHPQHCYGGYHYGPPHSERENGINFRLLLAVGMGLMVALHISRPQTAIIQIDPHSGSVLRTSANGATYQQQLYPSFDNKDGSAAAAASAVGGAVSEQQSYAAVAPEDSSTGFTNQADSAMMEQQQQMMGGADSSFSSNAAAAVAAPASPYLSSPAGGEPETVSGAGPDDGMMATPAEGGTMYGETVQEAQPMGDTGATGAEGLYGETTDGGVVAPAEETPEGFVGEPVTAELGGEMMPAEGGEMMPEGVAGEVIPPEGEVAPEAAAAAGEAGRLPGTLPGTGNVDLSLSDLDNFKDAWDPYETTDNAVFWHIPKAGGSTVKDVIGTCHRFVMATEFGITDGHENDPEIAVVYPGGGPVGQDRSPFVNVDTTTVEGIERAKQMGFADSGLADAIVTPFIHEANELFTPTAKGRLFTVFRDPIDRAISLFYYIQVADWEPTYSPELVNWSLEQYAQSDIIENNWMTRQLTKQYEGDLNDDHLQLAMEVVRRKFLVGLMTQIERTVERFERYFRWTYHVNPPNQEKCRERLLDGGSNKNASGNKKEKPQEGSEAYELLRLQNVYDLQLFEYIESLFEEQEEFVADIPADFRNIDATCCKCFPPTFPPEGFDCPLAILN